jgi:ketosteroid isomerase-like protein
MIIQSRSDGLDNCEFVTTFNGRSATKNKSVHRFDNRSKAPTCTSVAYDTAMFASDQLNIQKEKRMRNQSLFLKKMTALATALMFLVALSVARVEAAATYELTSEQIETVIEDVFAGLAAFDVRRVVNNFASDAVVEDPVGTPPIQGTQAIAAYLETFPSLFSQIKIYSLDVKVCGQEAAVKWRLRFKTKTGNVFFLEGIGFFKFNQEGKVQSEREFFDLAAFLAQLQD